jgi:hypothetical protein
MDRYTCPDGTPHCAHYDDGGTCCKCNDTAASAAEWFTSDEVVRRSAITYRQLDYFVRQGSVLPSLREAAGSGTRRRWSPLDLARLQAIGAVFAGLRDLGLADGLDTRFVEGLWHGLRSHPDGYTRRAGPVTLHVVLDDYLSSVT